MFKCRVVLAISLFIPMTTSIAQNLIQNLQGKTVRAICARDTSTLLIATNSGLWEFDGQSIEQVPIQVSGTLFPPQNLYDVIVDNDGTIWVASRSNGLFVEESSTNWIRIDTGSGGPEAPVNDLFTDSSGRIWIATEGEGTIIFVNGDSSWHRITEKSYDVFENGSWVLRADLDSLDHSERIGANFKDIKAVGKDKNGAIWLGTDGGLVRFNLANKILDSAAVADRALWQYYLEGESILSLSFDRNNDTWVGTLRSGVFRFDGNGISDTLNQANSPLQSNRIRDIELDRDGFLWFGTGSGVCRFNPEADKSSPNRWRCLGEEQHPSLNVGVQSVFSDSDNNLWFGLLTSQGVLRLNNNWFTFGKESLGEFPFVSTLLLNDEDLWVGLSNGIVRLRGEDAIQTIYPGLYNQISNLSPAKDSQIWVGSFGDGVFLYDKNGVEQCFLDNKGKPDEMGRRLIDAFKRITQIVERNDEVWIATLDGLSRFSLIDSTWHNYTAMPGGLISDQVTALAFDNSGKLWCGTGDGVSILNPESDTWEPSFTTNNGLSNNQVNTIAVNPINDKVWIGTNGGGISIYTSTGWEYLTRTTVLPDNAINQILFSDTGFEVWIATPSGVSRRDKNGIWGTFNALSGLASDFVQTIALQGDSLRWFGTWSSGLTRYRPPKSLPNTFIESRLDVTDKTEVTYHFSASDLNSTQSEFRFQYWIDTEEPSEPTFDKFAIVPVPEPVTGPHTFYVRAIDRDGNYDREPARDYFYRIDPNLGGHSTFVDKTSFSKIDSVVINLYWPPNFLTPNTEIIIEPVAMNDMDSLALFAFDLSMNDSPSEKRITLEFSFPINDFINSRRWGIYEGYNGNYTSFGGTSKRVDDKMAITTAIKKLGRYSVREIGSDFNPMNPTEFSVEDVQPRIFSPYGGELSRTTTLSFNLQQSAEVKVKVYNLAGRLVKAICNQQMQAGINAVSWDGKDDNGKECASGLYIVTIEANKSIIADKVMVSNKFLR